MTLPRHPQRPQALLMLLVANVFWGLSFPLIKAIVLTHARLLPESSGWFITAYTVAPRFVLATIVVALWQWRARMGVTAKELKQGLGIGLFSSVGMIFQNDGLQYTAASTSAFLTQFYALLIPLYLAVKLKQLPGWTVSLSSALVLAGVAILGNFDWHQLRFGRGEIETLVSSTFFMGQILLLEQKTYAENRPGPMTLVMFTTQAIAFVVVLLATTPSLPALWVPWTSGSWVGFTLVLTALSTLGSYLIMNVWQPKITATEAGLMYCFEPIFGSIMALFLPAIFSAWAEISYPNEKATTNLVIGGSLITAANLLIQLKPPAKASKAV